ncbi:MAG: type II secretion system protein, partial [Candidatus Hinthialibacter sp.]
MKEQSRNSFTLIELLIVVAIIGILAAIAVPNFLNAQTRAKVSRVKSDLYSIGNASEMYRLDHNAFPWPQLGGTYIARIVELTTPVSYISSVDIEDPFNPRNMEDYFQPSVPTYVWVNYRGQ